MKRTTRFLTALALFCLLSPPPVAGQCSRPDLDFTADTVDDHFIITSSDLSVPDWKKNWDQARRLFKKKDYTAARAAYERVLAGKDNVDLARWEYITLLMCRSDWQKAARELDLLISHDGERPRYRLAGAEIALGRGDFDQAIRLFGSLYQQQCDAGGDGPAKVRILSGYIAALEGAGRIEVLVPLLEQLSRLRPHDIQVKKKLAAVALENGQPDRALNVLKPLLAAGNDDPEILETMARSYGRLGSREQAALFWQKSIGTGHATPAAHAALVNYYQQAGNPAMELVHVKKLLAADPGNYELLKRAGRLNFMLGRPDRALTCYDLLLARQPRDFEIIQDRQKALHEVAARLFALIENSGPALLWPDLIQVTADRSDVFRELAAMLRQRGMDNELIEVLTIMYRENSSDTGVRDELAALLQKQAAARTIARARENDPSAPGSITR